ncbi:MAG TPA: helix-turn-helix domain-containing protein [Candidatus Thermoplasmatota archaeon]|nr:helix-turn-helix domain-containing protein [Candidatus Thermoplasmatota archaeon]
MAAEELQFRVAFDGTLTEFSRRNPHAVVSLWCDWRREVVEIVGAASDEVERLRARLAEGSSFVEVYPLGPATHVLVMDCVDLPHDFVYRAVDAAHCVHVPPTRFEAGFEHYTVMSFSESRSRHLFKAMRAEGREIELLHKRALDVQPLLNTRSVPLLALLSQLTDRQVDALLLAARHGMYDSPRRTTAAAIADSVGLSRSTFEEHLRKAENRLLLSLVPHLELSAKARKAAAAPATPAAPPT